MLFSPSPGGKRGLLRTFCTPAGQKERLPAASTPAATAADSTAMTDRTGTAAVGGDILFIHLATRSRDFPMPVAAFPVAMFPSVATPVAPRLRATGRPRIAPGGTAHRVLPAARSRTLRALAAHAAGAAAIATNTLAAETPGRLFPHAAAALFRQRPSGNSRRTSQRHNEQQKQTARERQKILHFLPTFVPKIEI